MLKLIARESFYKLFRTLCFGELSGINHSHHHCLKSCCLIQTTRSVLRMRYADWLPTKCTMLSKKLIILRFFLGYFDELWVINSSTNQILSHRYIYKCNKIYYIGITCKDDYVSIFIDWLLVHYPSFFKSSFGWLNRTSMPLIL